MKKRIFLFTVIYTIIYATIYFILDKFNLTLLTWVKELSMLIITLGIITSIYLMIKNVKRNKTVKFLLYFGLIIISCIILGIDLFIWVFLLNTEKVDDYEGRKMIKETRQVYKTNYIKYYDYINPFVRSKQERVLMTYDDAISEREYASTNFYNKDGKEVRDIEGHEFMDLSSLEKYTNKDVKYEDVLNFIQEVNSNYGKNIYKVENPNNFLFIYVTDVEDELVTEEGQKQELQDKIQEFKENQKSKKDSIYRISIWKDYVCIFNQKYYRLENM